MREFSGGCSHVALAWPVLRGRVWTLVGLAEGSALLLTAGWFYREQGTAMRHQPTNPNSSAGWRWGELMRTVLLQNKPCC